MFQLNTMTCRLKSSLVRFFFVSVVFSFIHHRVTCAEIAEGDSEAVEVQKPIDAQIHGDLVGESPENILPDAEAANLEDMASQIGDADPRNPELNQSQFDKETDVRPVITQTKDYHKEESSEDFQPFDSAPERTAPTATNPATDNDSEPPSGQILTVQDDTAAEDLRNTHQNHLDNDIIEKVAPDNFEDDDLGQNDEEIPELRGLKVGEEQIETAESHIATVLPETDSDISVESNITFQRSEDEPENDTPDTIAAGAHEETSRSETVHVDEVSESATSTLTVNTDECINHSLSHDDTVSQDITRNLDITEGMEIPASKEDMDETPEDSLASFYEKATNTKEGVNLIDGLSATSFESLVSQQQQEAQIFEENPTGSQDSATDESSINTEKEYRGVPWGTGFSVTKRRISDLELLYNLFRDRVMDELGLSYRETDQAAVFPLGVGSRLEEEDFVTYGAIKTLLEEKRQMEKKPNDSTDTGSILNETKDDDFVEGLDDIDKFFQGVNPPEELDVGASGISMQDLIMEKGRKILWKRLRMGFDITKDLLVSANGRIRDSLQRLFEDQDNQESQNNAWAKIKESAASGRRILSSILDKLTGSQNDSESAEADLDFDLDEIRKIRSMTF